MSKDIFTRVIRGDMNHPAVRQAVSWFERIQDRNHFDPDVLTYPSTALIQAYDKQSGKPVLYMPVHRVYMMEALGPSPEADGYTIAAALAQIVKTCAWDAPKDGIGELHYACTDPQIDGFCCDHGFVRMLYDTGQRTQPVPDETKKEQPDAMPVMADMPHYKFKVYR